VSGMELNKLVAAVLVAGIIAALAGFIAKEVVHPHALQEDAVSIEAAEAGGSSGAAKEALPEPILAMIANADIARGEKISKACAACHSFGKEGGNGTGPNLWNIVNRPKGAKSDFSYSDAMHEKGGNWNYAELNHYLWKPKKFVPGTKMNFIGLKKPEDRAALLAWLRTLSDSMPALPDEASIVLEQSTLGMEEDVLSEEKVDSPALESDSTVEENRPEESDNGSY